MPGTVENDAIDFSDDDLGGPAHDSQVRKSRFSDNGADAIEIEGENHLVEKNRFAGAVGRAIVLEDSAAGGNWRTSFHDVAPTANADIGIPQPSPPEPATRVEWCINLATRE